LPSHIQFEASAKIEMKKTLWLEICEIYYYRASDRVRKTLRNYAAFLGELCGKRGPIV